MNNFLPLLFITAFAAPAIRAHIRNSTSMHFLLSQLLGITVRFSCVLIVFWLATHTLESWLTQTLVFAATASGWAVVETSSHLCYRFFKLPLTRIVAHLPIKSADDNSWSSSVAYIKGFFPFKVFGYFAAAGTSLALFVGLTPAPYLTLSPLAVACGLIAGIWLTRLCIKPKVRLSETESKFLVAAKAPKKGRLHQSQREIELVGDPTSIAQGKNIVLIINESVGANAPSAQNKDKLLADRLVDLAGDPHRWVNHQAALTASTCTDISIPCLVTGCAPHESAERLHFLPTVFDIAKAAGLKTVFATSCTLKWANFDQFFALKSIDTALGPLEKSYPIINELNCDDALIIEDLCNYLKQTTEPVCAVVYLNSLHIPFQADSKIEVPAELTDRRDRATYITEQSHRMIFEALQHSGRYDSSLIFTIGDHGELPQVTDEKLGDLSRLTQLSASVLHPMLLIRVPDCVPPQHRQAVQANSCALTSLIDIVPTVTQFLGCTLSDRFKADGFSLFEPIPATRIHYTLGVNEWRTWPRSAVAIAHQNMRVCIDYQSVHHACVDTQGLPFTGDEARKKDELLERAMGEPLVRNAIGRVFVDKLTGCD